MEKLTTQNQVQVRKPYQKPRLEVVRLVPDQAVLSNCKFGGDFTGQGAYGACHDDFNGVDCVTIAS